MIYIVGYRINGRCSQVYGISNEVNEFRKGNQNMTLLQGNPTILTLLQCNLTILTLLQCNLTILTLLQCNLTILTLLQCNLTTLNPDHEPPWDQLMCLK